MHLHQDVRRSCGLCVAAITVAVHIAAAQVHDSSAAVRGMVRDSLGGGISNVLVTLTHLRTRTGFTTRSDSAGAFVVRSPEGGGLYALVLLRAGYRPLVVRQFGIPASTTMQLNFRLSQSATRLAPVHVRERAGHPSATTNGFDVRRATAVGFFLDERDLAKWRNGDLEIVFEHVPGVHVESGAGSQAYVTNARGPGSPGGGCYANVWVDGILAAEGTPFDVNAISTDQVEAIEVYVDDITVPPAFRGNAAGCGTVLIWTKK